MAQLRDYIPQPDAEFDAFQKNLFDIMNANQARFGIPAGEINALIPFKNAWEAAFEKARKPTTRTSGEVEAKNKAREEYEEVLRPFVKRNLTNNPAVKTKDLKDMDLTVPDDEQTPSRKPTRSPALRIDKIENQQHTLRILDKENPDTRAKPAGVKQTQIHRFIGTSAPSGPQDYTYIGNAGKFTFISEFTAEDEGKKAWYIGRYESTRGEVGPFSEPVHETIA